MWIWTQISILHRITAALFGTMLCWSAAMQVNDPDPWRWVAMYASLGVVAWLAAAWRVQRVLVATALLVATAWSASLWPSVFELFLHHPASDLFTGMSPDRPYVERAREALGLSIGILAMGHLLLASRARSHQ